jgi:hypothetical protein
MLHHVNGVSICGPYTCPRSKNSCAWSSQHWARRSAQTPLPAGRARLLQDLPHLCTVVKVQPSTACSSIGLNPSRSGSTRHDIYCLKFGKVWNVKKKRYTDYIMYSTFLASSPGSVLFSRSNLLKRKDLCFSCLKLDLIRHRRSLRSSHLSSQVCHDSHRVTLDGVPLLAPSSMVSRSAVAFHLPLQPATSTSLRQIAPPRHSLDRHQCSSNADVSALGCWEVDFIGNHGQNPKLV